MDGMPEKLKAFAGHRWLVFVCAMWVQSFAGMAYMFGSISPVIKTAMGYNQKQIALLGVAKDLGDNIGLVAGKISESSPTWRLLLVGILQNFLGYGILWLVVTRTLPSFPLWAVSSSSSRFWFFWILNSEFWLYYAIRAFRPSIPRFWD